MNDSMEGIIIDHREYREQDALLVLLNEEGRLISVSAKGIQKLNSKNAPACQLFTHCRLLLNYHETATIQSLRTAELLESYRPLRENLQKQAIASYFCEALLQSKFETREAYELLKKSLDILCVEEDGISILCLFQALINRMHGVEMVCDSCVRCGSVQQIYAVSLRDGGFVCKACAKSFDKAYHKEDLKRFRMLAKAELMHYDILKQQGDLGFQHFEQLYDFFEEYTGITLRSIRFLRILKDMERNS